MISTRSTAGLGAFALLVMATASPATVRYTAVVDYDAVSGGVFTFTYDAADVPSGYTPLLAASSCTASTLSDPSICNNFKLSFAPGININTGNGTPDQYFDEIYYESDGTWGALDFDVGTFATSGTYVAQSFGFGSIATLFVERIGGAVPEPATWALMMLGFGATGLSLRRRRITSYGAARLA